MFDTLYGLDAKLNPHPQMAEGQSVEDGGKRWTIKLRDGLVFHDGEPVLARDCVASLQRWMKRDAVGQILAARLDALEAPDDRTLVFRLKQAVRRPALRPGPDPAEPAGDHAGADRRDRSLQAGHRSYRQRAVPVRAGRVCLWQPRGVRKCAGLCAAAGAAGLHRRRPSACWWTGSNGGSCRTLRQRRMRCSRARSTGWKSPLPDLLPLLRGNSNVVVDRLDLYGLYPVARFNCLQGPTANIGVRQAILAAVDPVEVMQAVMGEDSSAYNAPVGVFLPGTPSANTAGMDRVGGKKPVAEIKAMLKAAGYNGEKLVLLHPTDQTFYNAMAQVVAAHAAAASASTSTSSRWTGARWCSAAPARSRWTRAAGRCSPRPSRRWTTSTRWRTPAARGNGAKAWFGWPDDPKVEALHGAWLDTSDPAEQSETGGGDPGARCSPTRRTCRWASISRRPPGTRASAVS